jgi:D-alanyl-D-alanine dipeptidase
MRFRCLPAVVVVLALGLAAPAGAAAKDPVAPKGAFVSLHQVAPSILLDIRYRTFHNFIGRPITGYREGDCLVTRQAADALVEVQAAVRARGYTLKMYDCYRPQRAVDDFVAWGKKLHEQRMKAEFYPHEPKARVFEDGYIAKKSGHTNGSTVDLTLVKLPARPEAGYKRGQKLHDCAGPFSKRFRDNSLDMGTGYDCFDSASHPFSKKIHGRQRANRLRLRKAMLAHGFKPLATEWWHFTLKNEPFPATYFDFPVALSSLR